MAATISKSEASKMPRESSDPAHPVAPATHILNLSIILSISQASFFVEKPGAMAPGRGFEPTTGRSLKDSNLEE
jgi:hypothetical protein